MKRIFQYSEFSLYLLIFFPLFIFSCNKQEKVTRPFPLVTTTSVEVIPDSGAHFYGAITLREGPEITEYGFLWSTSATPLIESAEYKAIGHSFSGGGFDKIVPTTFYKGHDYYIRAYARTQSLIIYGNILKFTSLGGEAPKITGFSPGEGAWGDTITITGQNFSNRLSTNLVRFNMLTASIISNSDTLIRVTVPKTLSVSKSCINIMITGNVGYARDSFLLRKIGDNSLYHLKNNCGYSPFIAGIFKLNDQRTFLCNFKMGNKIFTSFMMHKPNDIIYVLKDQPSLYTFHIKIFRIFLTVILKTCLVWQVL
jgi:IPT/TIG domain